MYFNDAGIGGFANPFPGNGNSGIPGYLILLDNAGS